MGELLRETLVLLSADIDDETPQVLACAQARALAAGALDCVLIPTHMKKGRPAIRLEVLCREEQHAPLVELILRETSTLGVRIARVERVSLPRVMRCIEWRGHSIAVKLALDGGAVLRAAPEYDDCLRVSEALGLPLRAVLEGARAAALARFPPGSTPGSGD